MTSPTASALGRAAAIGPYFEVGLTAGRGWRALSELTAQSGVLDERVHAVRQALALRTGLPAGEVDGRAAASIHSLALMSRLIAPSLATAVLNGTVVAPEPDAAWWQPVEGGAVPIAWTAVRTQLVLDAPSAAAELHRAVVEPLVAPLVAAFAEAGDGRPAVSRTVLWGNVASAAVGAAAMLANSGAAAVVDPGEVVRELLSAGPLEGAGTFDVPGRAFVRNSCCLFYKIPNAGKCGDCVLL